MANDNKRFGTLYEHAFVVEALRRGLQPHMPVGDYMPHDIVVYNSEGVCFRVQVKGTSYLVKRPGNSPPRFKVVAKAGGNIKPIDCSVVDIIAAYVAPVDTWYLVPCPVTESIRSLWLYPLSPDSSAKYEKYKEEWGVFD